MATNDIVKKIISDAEEKAESILAEYKKEADELKEKRKRELEKEKEESLKKIELEAENHKKRLIQMANLEIRKDILNFKQKMVEEVFKKVFESILQTPTDKYLEYIEKKIISAITTGDEKVIVGKKDKDRITIQFINEINKKLKEKLREEGKLSVAEEEADFEAGFILKGEKIQINNSIENVLKDLKERVESDIVNKLFKE